MNTKQAKHYRHWVELLKPLGASIRGEKHPTDDMFEMTFHKSSQRKGYSLTMVFNLCGNGKVDNLWFDIYTPQQNGVLIKHNKYAASKTADLFIENFEALQS
jgi:hypothetical protein